MADLGKGPSFARLRNYDLGRYRTASLNHVVRELPVDVAHFIDLEALATCADSVIRNARWLLVPRQPHVQFHPSLRPIEEYFAEVPVLAEMSRAGRLVCYHHEVPWSRAAGVPVPPGEQRLHIVAFSAEAVVAALAVCGVRVVRTLGIDGGTSYAEAFADLRATTRLVNSQPNFDAQFINIQRIVSEHGMDYGPLEEPIRVFVGTDDSQMVAAKVLEYSIRKYATRPVELVPMLNVVAPTPKDPRNRARTGFSFARLMIPRLAAFRGRAIYLDADMLVFGDISEIWELPMDGVRVHCSRQDEPPAQWRDNPHFQPGRQMSVMLLDCARLDWDIEVIVRGLDEGRFTYEQLMFDLCIVPAREIGDAIPSTWNSLEHFEPGRTRLLHFTDMTMQPWRFSHNPRGSIWRAFYREAVEAGAVAPELIQAGAAAGYLMPALRHDLALAASSRPTVRALASGDGVGSERQRALELEAMALRAELDAIRRQPTDVGRCAQCEALSAQCEALSAQCEALGAQREALGAQLGISPSLVVVESVPGGHAAVPRHAPMASTLGMNGSGAVDHYSRPVP